MEKVFEHRQAVIHINERYVGVDGVRIAEFGWLAKAYGKVIGEGTEYDKIIAEREAAQACDAYLDRPQVFDINLWEDGSVVTRDGEYLGIWEADENDHPSFTPEGATDALFFENWKGLLCKKIAAWHNGTLDQEFPG
jgi:hypothetical protein